MYARDEITASDISINWILLKIIAKEINTRIRTKTYDEKLRAHLVPLCILKKPFLTNNFKKRNGFNDKWEKINYLMKCGALVASYSQQSFQQK